MIYTLYCLLITGVALLAQEVTHQATTIADQPPSALAVSKSNVTIINLTFEPQSLNADTLPEKHGVAWGEEHPFHIHVEVAEPNRPEYKVRLTLQCEHDDLCTVNNGTALDIELSKANDFRHSLETTLQAIFIGRTNIRKMHFTVNDDEHAAELHHPLMEVTILRSQLDQSLNDYFTYFLSLFIIVNTFMMGTQLHWSIIIKVLRRPVGPVIGFVCQYGLMPLLAFLYSKIFLRGWPNLQFGLFAFGCSPGGGASNFWSILLEGNLDLSVAMTFVSNCAALAMMPLWIYTVGERLFDIDGYTAPPMPIGNIIISLLMLLVPIGLGMGFASWKPQTIPTFKKVVKWFTLVAIVIIVSSSIYVNWFVFQLIFGFQKHTIVPGCLMPLSGFILSYSIGWIMRQRYRECRTIAIETGIQNAGVAIVICQMSLPPPDSDLTMVMPVVCLLFTMVPLFMWLAGRTIAKRFFGYVDQDVKEDNDRDRLSRINQGLALGEKSTQLDEPGSTPLTPISTGLTPTDKSAQPLIKKSQDE